MTLLDALSTLASMEAPVFATSDAAARLRVPNGHASVMLARLAASGQVIRLRRGVWAFPGRVDPLALPEYLTALFPAYVPRSPRKRSWISSTSRPHERGCFARFLNWSGRSGSACARRVRS